MQSPEIVKHYYAYLEAHPKTQSAEVSGPVAMVFGTDEATLDPVGRTVVFPGNTRVAYEPRAFEHKQSSIEWYALVSTGQTWAVVLGVGNPYSAEGAVLLPKHNGLIMASPACLNPAIQETKSQHAKAGVAAHTGSFASKPRKENPLTEGLTGKQLAKLQKAQRRELRGSN